MLTDGQVLVWAQGMGSVGNTCEPGKLKAFTRPMSWILFDCIEFRLLHNYVIIRQLTVRFVQGIYFHSWVVYFVPMALDTIPNCIDL